LLALFVGSCAAHRALPGSVLTIGQQQEPISLNPALENGQRSTQWGELLFSYLVKYDDHGRMVPDAATEVPSPANGGISKDGLTITYHLRRGIRFADGVPLTAHDCAWSIAAINDPQNNVQSRYGYDRIASARAPDDRTLVLKLKARFAPIVSLVLAPQGFPILPAHLLARYPNFNDLAFNEQPVGSGPYVVDRWVRNDRVEMHANPYYFLGKPAIERIVVTFIPNPAEAANQLATGEIAAYFNEQDYSQYRVLRTLRGVRVLDAPTSAVGALIFNTQRAPESDDGVRQALTDAIDVPALVDKAYAGALDSREAGRGLFLWAFDPGAYPDTRYDPARARMLLEREGWQLGVDGIRRKNGVALDLVLAIQSGILGEEIAASEIAQYERAIGARVTIKSYNVTLFGAPAALGGPVYGGKFDLALYSFVNGDDPDTTDQFACARVPPNGYNKSRICDPRIDALLRAGRSTYDLAQRTAIYRPLQRLLAQRMPIVLLYQRRELDVVPAWLQGASVSIDSLFWDVGRWSVSRPRAVAASARSL
jgi:peptide/nickel transport system substrate-binding protein